MTTQTLLWQLHRGCLATIIVSVKSKTLERLQVPFTEEICVPQSIALMAVQRSRAHLHQPPADRDDPSRMKGAVFSSSLAYISSRVISFFKNISLRNKCINLYIVYLSGEIIEFGSDGQNDHSGRV